MVTGSLLAASSLTSLEAAKLSDVINNASIDGFAFGRVHAVDGRDGEGVRYQFRFKPTITSGAIYGVSASAGLFFSKGSSTPDNNTADNNIHLTIEGKPSILLWIDLILEISMLHSMVKRH